MYSKKTCHCIYHKSHSGNRGGKPATNSLSRIDCISIGIVFVSDLWAEREDVWINMTRSSEGVVAVTLWKECGIL
jgi:hypothetical protein